MDESLKNAIKYISSRIKENGDADMLNLIEDAAKMFDLNPLQSEFLINKFFLS